VERPAWLAIVVLVSLIDDESTADGTLVPMGGWSIDGATIRRSRAHLTARETLSGRPLARRLCQQVDSWFDGLAADLPSGWALMATGGYARGLLCPGSDIDVVLVHPPKTRADEVQRVAESLWYPLWDGGVKLSPAVHSPKSLLALAGDDLVTATSILRLRWLAGDRGQVDELQAAGVLQWRKRATHWLSELREASEERWHRLGEVASRLEPDLKDGRGGLRDHDVLRWALASGRQDVANALETPLDDLAGAAETLLAVRCELHRTTGKPTNVLLLQDQDAVAARMGFVDADVLMAKVSEAASLLDWAGERFWWRVGRITRLGSRATTGQSRPLPDSMRGVYVVDDEVEVSHDVAVDEQSLAFRVAAAAAHGGYPISRRALVTMSGRATDDAEQWSERTRRAFISLLGSGQQVVAAVESLEQYDLFSRYFPEWRHVRSLPQRNAFHTYTVDRHLLQTVANASEFVRDVTRPDLLLVGALLHDIGKGYPGDHTDAGVELIDVIGPRMGFAPEDVDVIRTLVRLHLLLSETATRRDLSDPRTITNVAEAVGSVQVLELLRALTEADSLATGPSAWSSWKAALIETLVNAVRAQLAGNAIAIEQPPVEQRFPALVERIRSGEPLHTEAESIGDLHVWRVATVDRRGVFAKVAGVVAIHGLDIIGAEAATTPDGIVIDQFHIVSSRGIEPNWSRIEHDLRAALAGTMDVAGKIEQRIRTYDRAHRRAVAATRPRLEVLISNTASDSTTMIDVRAPDALAVLYRLSATIAAQGFDIRSAKVATLGHEVVDVFYVQTGTNGSTGQIAEHEHGRLRDELKLVLATS
jgi:[protein-PII] uridylyltransferase